MLGTPHTTKDITQSVLVAHTRYTPGTRGERHVRLQQSPSTNYTAVVLLLPALRAVLADFCLAGVLSLSSLLIKSWGGKTCSRSQYVVKEMIRPPSRFTCLSVVLAAGV